MTTAQRILIAIPVIAFVGILAATVLNSPPPRSKSDLAAEQEKAVAAGLIFTKEEFSKKYPSDPVPKTIPVIEVSDALNKRYSADVGPFRFEPRGVPANAKGYAKFLLASKLEFDELAKLANGPKFPRISPLTDEITYLKLIAAIQVCGQFALQKAQLETAHGDLVSVIADLDVARQFILRAFDVLPTFRASEAYELVVSNYTDVLAYAESEFKGNRTFYSRSAPLYQEFPQPDLAADVDENAAYQNGNAVNIVTYRLSQITDTFTGIRNRLGIKPPIRRRTLEYRIWSLKYNIGLRALALTLVHDPLQGKTEEEKLRALEPPQNQEEVATYNVYGITGGDVLRLSPNCIRWHRLSLLYRELVRQWPVPNAAKGLAAIPNPNHLNFTDPVTGSRFNLRSVGKSFVLSTEGSGIEWTYPWAARFDPANPLGIHKGLSYAGPTEPGL